MLHGWLTGARVKDQLSFSAAFLIEVTSRIVDEGITKKDGE
ncbi:hypothetical protein [Cytobacillus citreus]|nr:hypothetical protein [Cytobacillus citreus]